MTARERRISSDYEQIKKTFANHKHIVVEPIGAEPAEKYRVTYYLNGIYLLEDGRIETLGKHIVIITLHAEYPRYKPVCTIATPIWHPNFRDGQICIGDIWGAGESLCDIIVNIGDMIQYKSWNSYSPLSADAADWAIENKHLFPVGTIDLWTGEEASGDIANGVEIELLSDSNEAIAAGEVMAAETVDEPASTEIFNNVEAVMESEQDAPVDENDFEISADELAGIEFIPTATRMQGSQYGATAKGARINIKTIFMKGILYGLIGGLVGWLLQEFVLKIDSTNVLSWMGHTMESLVRQTMSGTISENEVVNILRNATRLSSGISFMGVGAMLGAVMGVGEGIYYGSKENAIKYGAIGLGVGLVLGFLGGYIGQIIYSTLLSDTTEYTSEIYKAFVRALGWAILGGGIGTAVGLIKPEKMRIINCIIGGFAGGFVGGFLFDFIATSVSTGENDTGLIPRVIGIVLMGALIGLGIGLLEQFAKSAWLKVIRGEFEGKEYLVFAGTTSIGNGGKNTIVLFKDKLVAPNHCDIVQEGSKYVIVDKGSPMGTVVNGMRVNRHVLRQGDAIAIGNSVLVFNTK